MTFHEVRLPEDIERGAQGGPEFNTTILELSSGHERRNENWSRARMSWDIGYGIMSDDDAVDTNFRTLLDFFYNRHGRSIGFRFKDWTDFILDRQAIGETDPVEVETGRNNQFQVFKRYTSGGATYDRVLQKLVSGTVRLWVDGTERVVGGGTGQFQVNVNTGVVTLGTDLRDLPSALVEVACEFDIPVRFDTDKLELNVALWNAASVPSIPIVELLPE